jgi:hypothetical protein
VKYFSFVKVLSDEGLEKNKLLKGGIPLSESLSRIGARACPDIIGGVGGDHHGCQSRILGTLSGCQVVDALFCPKIKLNVYKRIYAFSIMHLYNRDILL